MHQLTGDFYTAGEVLGHTLVGIGSSLGLSMNFEAVTARYVDVQLERKKKCLAFTTMRLTRPSCHQRLRKLHRRKQKAGTGKKAAKSSFEGGIYLLPFTALYKPPLNMGTILTPQAVFSTC